MKRYKVGDIVQIRQWDDMAEEFGTTIHGSIACRSWYFVEEMKKYCGKKLRIIGIRNFNDAYYLNTGNHWTFTSEMFEKGGLSMLITRRQECIK